MTKEQWRTILTELRDIRQRDTTPIYFKDKLVDKVSVDEMYIRFQGREYMTHDHVLNDSPKTIKRYFTWTRQVFK